MLVKHSKGLPSSLTKTGVSVYVAHVCVCVWCVCVCVRMLAWMCVPVYNGVQLRTVAIS